MNKITPVEIRAEQEIGTTHKIIVLSDEEMRVLYNQGRALLDEIVTREEIDPLAPHD